MMHEMIKILFSMSLVGTLMIFLLLLFRPLYEEHLSKSWQYYIWLIVIFRLLLPWSLEENLMQNFLPIAMKEPTSTMEQYQKEESLWQKFSEEETLDVLYMETDKMYDQTGEIEGVNVTKKEAGIKQLGFLQKFVSLFLQKMHIIWLVVALVLFIRKITIYQSFAKYIRASSHPVEDINSLEYIGKVMKQNHIRGAVEIYTNSLVSSPMFMGFYHPCIVLPALEVLSDRDFHYTVMHELVHYKRKDMFYKWLVQVTVCLHWFNPFVYLMEQEISRLCELSCDEAVIQNLDREERKQYGDTLLYVMGLKGVYKDPKVSLYLSEYKNLLKGRLKAIMKYKKKSKMTVVFAWILVVLFAVSAASFGIYQTPGQTLAASKNKKDVSEQEGYRILCEGNIYYIFAEGALESDKPLSNTTAGSISLVFVREDGYTQIGPFSNMKKLTEEVAEQCKYLKKKEIITKTQAKGLLAAAKEIQDIYEPGSVKFTKLNKKSITLSVGNSDKLKITGTAKNITWSSVNDKIVMVDMKGKVTAKQVGKTKVYAKVGKVTYVCKVKVVHENASQKTYTKDYEKYGITEKNGIYWYEGKRIRIFMDVRFDNSFVLFNYDKEGCIDLRLRRGKDNSITKREELTKEEAEKIQKDYETASHDKKPDTASFTKVVRITEGEAPASIRNSMQSCQTKKWYILKYNKKQYIYYKGLPKDYAFETETNGKSLKLNVSDIGSKKEQYVLLSVQSDLPISIYYNHEQVSYKNGV